MRIVGPVASASRHRSPAKAPVPVIGRTRRGKLVRAIGGAASPLQQANAAEQRYARQPQTTTPDAAGGPFLLHSRLSEQFAFLVTNQSLGGVISQPFVPTPGFCGWLDVRLTASGGDAGNANVAAAPDAPFSVISNILLRDAFSQPLHTYTGYELYLLNLFSAQTGFWNAADVQNLPSWVTMDSDGNFEFRIRVPFALWEAYCSIPMASQAAMPTLRIQLGSSGDLYSTPPDTLPTIDVAIEEAFFATPLDDPNLAPEQNGSTSQWFSQPAATSIGSGGSTAITIPPLGAWLHTAILEFRNSIGERDDAILPADDATLEWWVDQVPEYMQEVGTLKDRIFREFGVTRPDGVLVITYRDALAAWGPVAGGIDTGVNFLPTNPGSVLQLRSSAWGSFQNAPAQLTVTTGRLYAKGGVPYTHLSDG